MAVLLGNGDGTLGTATVFGGGINSSATAISFAGFQSSIALGTGNQVVLVKNMTASK
jgi:hypothetical protein